MMNLLNSLKKVKYKNFHEFEEFIYNSKLSSKQKSDLFGLFVYFYLLIYKKNSLNIMDIRTMHRDLEFSSDMRETIKKFWSSDGIIYTSDNDKIAFKPIFRGYQSALSLKDVSNFLVYTEKFEKRLIVTNATDISSSIRDVRNIIIITGEEFSKTSYIFWQYFNLLLNKLSDEDNYTYYDPLNDPLKELSNNCLDEMSDTIYDISYRDNVKFDNDEVLIPRNTLVRDKCKKILKKESVYCPIEKIDIEGSKNIEFDYIRHINKDIKNRIKSILSNNIQVNINELADLLALLERRSMMISNISIDDVVHTKDKLEKEYGGYSKNLITKEQIRIHSNIFIPYEK